MNTVNADLVEESTQLTTEERLLQAAARLFREQGFTKTSTRELAKAVGLQSASLYHYMESKSDLLVTICERSYGLLIEAVTTATIDCPPDKLVETMIRTHLTHAVQNRNIHLTTLSEAKYLAPENRAKIETLRQQYSTILVNLISRAQAEGNLRSDVSAKHLTLIIRNQVSWPLFWFRETGEMNIDEFASLIYRLFIEGAGIGPRR